MTLGDILRNLLEERDMTQKQLANILNIAPSTLGNYVQNLTEPDYETLKRMAKYFDVTTDYLLSNRTGQTESPQEDKLLRVYRALTKDQQEIFIGQGKIFITQNNKKKRSSQLGII